jgi:hypothetical protein
MDPEHFEIRFRRESLDLRNFSVTFGRRRRLLQRPRPGAELSERAADRVCDVNTVLNEDGSE